MFLQILHSCKRGRNKIRMICHNPQFLKRKDIIINTAGGIIGYKYKLSPQIPNGFQKFSGASDQPLPDTYGSVNIQKKQPLFHQSFISGHLPPAF